eukprot:TRINITY_DN59655_c0_g1_i1.p1 TRINITY_DN59655_c0_g1~~TRINITY_DN59655_c0_g1_i1.p1  ORF type:complete len:610 (+),score=58.03 TRINITY_DN59655_c0_g1_i1:271-1830(+)
MTVVCTMYHYCDADGAGRAFGHSDLTACSPLATDALTRADHALALFCFVQMAFLMLGPEDNFLQRIGHATGKEYPRKKDAVVPLDVWLFARALPMVALSLLVVKHPPRGDFHWFAAVLCVCLLLLGTVIFWSHRGRRRHAPQVLLQTPYWRRLGTIFVLPQLLALIFMLSGASNSEPMHACWHVVLAGLATFGFHCAYNMHDAITVALGRPPSKVRDGNVFVAAPANPSIVLWCMQGLAFCGVVAVGAIMGDAGFGVRLDELQRNPAPILGVLHLPQPAGYILALLGPVLMLGHAVSASLIASTVSATLASSSLEKAEAPRPLLLWKDGLPAESFVHFARSSLFQVLDIAAELGAFCSQVASALGAISFVVVGLGWQPPGASSVACLAPVLLMFALSAGFFTLASMRPLWMPTEKAGQQGHVAAGPGVGLISVLRICDAWMLALSTLFFTVALFASLLGAGPDLMYVKLAEGLALLALAVWPALWAEETARHWSTCSPPSISSLAAGLATCSSYSSTHG